MYFFSINKTYFVVSQLVVCFLTQAMYEDTNKYKTSQ